MSVAIGMDTTVRQLAASLEVSVEYVLKEMRNAGYREDSADASISLEDARVIIEYIKRNPPTETSDDISSSSDFDASQVNKKFKVNNNAKKERPAQNAQRSQVKDSRDKQNGRRRGKKENAVYSASYFSHSENPSIEDKLNREQLVDALAINLLHERNAHHRTIGLLGDWGSGKSTFLQLLKRRLRTDAKNQPFIFGEFNAWAYEHADNIQAGVAQEMIKALTTQPEFNDDDDVVVGWKAKCGKIPVWPGLALGWAMQRAKLTLQFSLKANSLQLLKILMLLIVAVIPWFGQQLNAIIDVAAAEPLNGWGYWLWMGGLGIYILRDMGKLIINPQAKELLTYLRLPSYAEHLGKVPVMRENIRIMSDLRLKKENGKTTRLLFVVDDLDRCSPEAIVKVIEAVRLVLELNNVIVVIAVDQQIALAALAAHYKDFSQHHKSNNAHAIARDYLAKVIHLPIVLKKPTNEEVKGFMSYLWDSAKEPIKNDAPAKVVATTVKVLNNADPTVSSPLGEDNKTVSSAKNEKTLTDHKSLSDEQKNSFIYWVNFFRLSNTRQLKRLNNSYDLMRAYLPSQDKEPIDFQVGTAKGIVAFPMLLTLILMEYVNSLGNRDVRKKLWNDLFLTATDTDLSDQSQLPREFIVGYRYLRDLDNKFDLVGYVESFVLPAVD